MFHRESLWIFPYKMSRYFRLGDRHFKVEEISEPIFQVKVLETMDDLEDVLKPDDPSEMFDYYGEHPEKVIVGMRGNYKDEPFEVIYKSGMTAIIEFEREGIKFTRKKNISHETDGNPRRVIITNRKLKDDDPKRYTSQRYERNVCLRKLKKKSIERFLSPCLLE